MQSFQSPGNRRSERGHEASQHDSQPPVSVSETDSDRKKVQQIVEIGYDACFWRDRESFDSFLAMISEPFKGQANQTQEQRLVVKALTLLLDSLRSETEVQDAEGGLVLALAFTHGVLFMESDVFEALEPEMVELGRCVFSILRDERFQPRLVLEDESENRLGVALNALSAFSYQNLGAASGGMAPSDLSFAQEMTLAGLQSALELFHSGALEHVSDAMVELKLSLIREVGNMARCFPSTSFAEPLLRISRECSIYCQQGHLFFPDITESNVEWDGDYKADEDDGGNWGEPEAYAESEQIFDGGADEASATGGANGTWRASMAFEGFNGEYEGIAAVCFSALAYCQSGDSLQAIWKHTLDRLEPQDNEWCSALVGLSLVNPEQIQVYLLDLFDSLSQTGATDDMHSRIPSEHYASIAMNALLELLAGNEQAGVQVKAVYENLPSAEKAVITERVSRAIDDGDVAIFGDAGRRQRTLEDQLRFVFHLPEPNGADGV